LTKVEVLRADRNSGSKAIGTLMRDKKVDEANALKARMSALGDEIAAIDVRLNEVEAEFRDAMLRIPNPPAPEVPVAPDESGNVTLKVWGDAPEFAFAPQPHWEIGERLGIIDMERGTKIAGSRFYLLRGAGARLQRALSAWFLDIHTTEHGYEEVYPPFMVRSLHGRDRQPAQVRRQSLP
jgi:seryl-tRNA synthetase